LTSRFPYSTALNRSQLDGLSEAKSLSIFIFYV
jgi:hypothetical protein